MFETFFECIIILVIGCLLMLIGFGAINALVNQGKIRQSDKSDYQCFIFFTAFFWFLMIPLELVWGIGYCVYKASNKVTHYIIERYG